MPLDAPAAPLGAALRVYVPPTAARNHPTQHRRVTRLRRVGAARGHADATSTARAYFAPAFFYFFYVTRPALGRAHATSTARSAPTGTALHGYVPPTAARKHPTRLCRVTRLWRVCVAYGRVHATSTAREAPTGAALHPCVFVFVFVFLPFFSQILVFIYLKMARNKCFRKTFIVTVSTKVFS